jgi:hypothetical protein
MHTLRKRIIAYFLSLFTTPRVKEMIAGYAQIFIGEAGRYTTGIKTEAIETKETFTILTRYIRQEKITREEKRKFKKQVVDILRSSGIFVPVMIIPLPFVGTLLLIIMDHLLLSMHIQLLPDAFYPKEKKELLTPQGIEKDLKKDKKFIF